jgi:hypothetical protein
LRIRLLLQNILLSHHKSLQLNLIRLVLNERFEKLLLIL